MSQAKRWWVYLILTSRNQLYTGITTDVERRWQEHVDMAEGKAKAKGAKFFRSQRPQKLMLCEAHPDRRSASKREAAIKAMTREQKLALLPGPTAEPARN